MTMPGYEFLEAAPLGYRAYLCVRVTGQRVDAGRLTTLCERLGLGNEFEGRAPKGESVAFLRRRGATAAQIADDDVLHADTVVHVASKRLDVVDTFCADADVPTFHKVCAALRDVARNPEWRFVREGPTWHGRRVSSAGELFG